MTLKEAYMFLAGLFGSETAEKVLLYMGNHGSGYPRGIANAFELPVSQVQRQLERFERDGIFVSRLIGKTREYQWNPRYLFRKELSALLTKALKNLPEETWRNISGFVCGHAEKVSRYREESYRSYNRRTGCPARAWRLARTAWAKRPVTTLNLAQGTAANAFMPRTTTSLRRVSYIQFYKDGLKVLDLCAFRFSIRIDRNNRPR